MSRRVGSCAVLLAPPGERAATGRMAEPFVQNAT